MATQTNENMESNIKERIGNLPLVNTTVNQVSALYSNTKERWWMARGTLGLAEKSLQIAAWTAKPLAEKMGVDVDGKMAMASQYACLGLDILGEKVPLLKKQPEEIVAETRKAVDSTVKAGSDCLLQTRIGQVMWWTTDTALGVTEKCVDYYLPSENKDDEAEEHMLKDAGTEKSVLVRASTLTDKVHRGLSEQAWRKIRMAQKCGREALDTLRDMLELIESAKSRSSQVVQESLESLQDRLMSVQKLVHQEPDRDEDTQSVERQILVVVTGLLQQVKSVCSVLALQVWALPQQLQDNITQAMVMADQLYDSFCKRLSEREALPGLCLHCQIQGVSNTLVSVTDFIWTLPPFPWFYSIYVLVRLGRAVMAVALYEKYALFFQEKYLLCQETYLLYLPDSLKQQVGFSAQLQA